MLTFNKTSGKDVPACMLMSPVLFMPDAGIPVSNFKCIVSLLIMNKLKPLADLAFFYKQQQRSVVYLSSFCLKRSVGQRVRMCVVD